MKKLIAILKKLCVFILFGVLISSEAFSAEINGLRIGQGIGSVRVVFDATSSFDYNVFLLDNPKRLVIDTDEINVPKSLEKTKDKNSFSFFCTGCNQRKYKSRRY